MKKFILIVSALLLVGLILVAIPFSIKYARVRYDNEMTQHLANADAGKAAGGEYAGVRTILAQENVHSAARALSRTELTLTLFPPRKSFGEPARLIFSDGAEFAVYPAPGEHGKDVVYIDYRFNGRHSVYKLTGYDTLARVVACVSPEGYLAKNKIAK